MCMYDVCTRGQVCNIYVYYHLSSYIHDIHIMYAMCQLLFVFHILSSSSSNVVTNSLRKTATCWGCSDEEEELRTFSSGRCSTVDP